jgi:hypothetical protein
MAYLDQTTDKEAILANDETFNDVRIGARPFNRMSRARDEPIEVFLDHGKLERLGPGMLRFHEWAKEQEFDGNSRET